MKNSKRLPESIEGALLEVDYVNIGNRSNIRLTVKSSDGKAYEIFDDSFRPYFYLVHDGTIKDFASVDGSGGTIRPVSTESCRRMLFGKPTNATKITLESALHVPRLSAALAGSGTPYENDIPFAKRYIIDKSIVPASQYRFSVIESDGKLILQHVDKTDGDPPGFSVMFFDIEVYNPLGAVRAEKDPIIMISYAFRSGSFRKEGVLTTKKIGLDYVTALAGERELIEEFASLVKGLDPDIVVGYNSSGFDIKYLLDRSAVLKIDFGLGRFDGPTRIENHGLVTKVKIPGRAHVDMFVVVKFISVVGAAESILKINSKTLKNVYEAVTGDKKFAVEKQDIFRLWDGSDDDLKTLATYNMADTHALEKVYDTFIPIMMELSRLTYNVLSDVCVSTTGQLVEFMLMHSSHAANEIIPNKPEEMESKARLSDPIEGAYVKTPDPGIYNNLVMFDFRGLYPSIIIAYNIDPSSICTDCTDYYESPDGVRFSKTRKSITPELLQMMINQRAEVKKAYKKDPSNIFLGSRSMALKIVSNSFYGYLGYARSRWYSRACASSVTAYGRQYIKEVMARAEAHGMKVIYGDTDSLVMLMGDKSKDDALKFMKEYNATLPESMELELEDFYKRGVFVGKKTDKTKSGAKKKYALISESGKIKIRGFELVRRDWSKIARDTQRMVLEAILKEGDKTIAADIVKGAVNALRKGAVPMSDLIINTQLRKSIEGYDLKSPELAAARRAVKEGLKRRDEVEGAVIGYIITRHGGSAISDRAVLAEFAKDYDPDYYITNQVIPATMRILKELNFDEDELKGLGMQKKLM